MKRIIALEWRPGRNYSTCGRRTANTKVFSSGSHETGHDQSDFHTDAACMTGAFCLFNFFEFSRAVTTPPRLSSSLQSEGTGGGGEGCNGHQKRENERVYVMQWDLVNDRGNRSVR